MKIQNWAMKNRWQPDCNIVDLSLEEKSMLVCTSRTTRFGFTERTIDQHQQPTVEYESSTFSVLIDQQNIWNIVSICDFIGSTGSDHRIFSTSFIEFYGWSFATQRTIGSNVRIDLSFSKQQRHQFDWCSIVSSRADETGRWFHQRSWTTSAVSSSERFTLQIDRSRSSRKIRRIALVQRFAPA